MATQNNKTILTLIQERYKSPSGDKVQKYINHFYGKTKKGNAIHASVNGNHGVYSVSIRVKKGYLDAGCSCYIGKHGGCHHVIALAHNYLATPASFEEQKITARSSVKNLKTLRTYLVGVSLEELMDELKTTKGITQAAFGRSIGMSSQHISAVKRSEARNRHFKELGAIKLACLYVLERKKIKE